MQRLIGIAAGAVLIMSAAGCEKCSSDTKVESSKSVPAGSICDAGYESIGNFEATTTLVKTDLRAGSGEEAVAGAKAVVHYIGKLGDGKQFDTSCGRGTFPFVIGAGRVIKGWDEGVAGMRVGGVRRLVIPPEMAYGSRSVGDVIPANSTLGFDVELVSVEK